MFAFALSILAEACIFHPPPLTAIPIPPNGTRGVPTDVVPAVLFAGSQATGDPNTELRLFGSEVRLTDANNVEVEAERRLAGIRVTLQPRTELEPGKKYRIQRLFYWAKDGSRLDENTRANMQGMEKFQFDTRLSEEERASIREVQNAKSVWHTISTFRTARRADTAPRPTITIDSVVVRYEEPASVCIDAQLDVVLSLSHPLPPWAWIDLIQPGRGIIESLIPEDEIFAINVGDGALRVDPIQFSPDADLRLEAHVSGRRARERSDLWTVRARPNGPVDPARVDIGLVGATHSQ
ncbi:MAG: hypothetical protein AAGA48_28965 [Myxococcota bacterium]